MDDELIFRGFPVGLRREGERVRPWARHREGGLPRLVLQDLGFFKRIQKRRLLPVLPHVKRFRLREIHAVLFHRVAEREREFERRLRAVHEL